ncbi:hypothetical protein C2G38_1235984 [Gigaspora rosea]|uniref:Uncharacterized protein n=1 Tax=Gigaspora rosea TaxID=44941 RepID=A0A397VDM0_9GLOM|nr:hypothetical protein C2G38_1235984 [Gigaspora rosea]
MHFVYTLWKKFTGQLDSLITSFFLIFTIYLFVLLLPLHVISRSCLKTFISYYIKIN